MQIFSSSDTMVQALKSGDSTTPGQINADQLKALQAEPDIKTVVGSSTAGPQLGVQHLWHREPARRSRAADRRPRRSSTRRSATRSATPSTSRSSSTGCSAASATSARHDRSRRCIRHVAHGADRSADVRHRAGEAEARCRRLRAGRERQPARQGGQADQPADGHARFRRRTIRRRPSSSRTGSPSSGSRSARRCIDSDTLDDLMLPPEAGGAGNQANYDLFVWRGRAVPDPNALLQIFKCDADRQLVGQPLVQP